MRKLLFILSIASLSLFANIANASKEKVEAYVNDLNNKAFAILNNSSLDGNEKSNLSRKLLAENLDLEWMSQFALGRHSRAITKEQNALYSAKYKKFIVKHYSDTIKDYKGEKIQIKNIHERDKGEYTVKSEVIRPNGQAPIDVDYLVRVDEAGNCKVFDIVTEGVSFIASQRSEFNSFISQRGIEDLINYLKDQVENDTENKA